MRFRIVELDLNVRQIIRCERKGPEGVELYEVCGFTDESGPRLYMGVVQDLPKGMPIGPDVQERARLVGYFFKVNSYYSHLAKPGAKPEFAPVILGRLVWEPSLLAGDNRDPIPPWLWLAGALGVTALAFGGVMIAVFRGGRRPARARFLSSLPDPDAPSVDQWLDRAQSEGVDSGNNFSGNGESSNGRMDHRPEEPGEGGFPRFPDDFGRITR
jgi:hypothetical protein